MIDAYLWWRPLGMNAAPARGPTAAALASPFGAARSARGATHWEFPLLFLSAMASRDKEPLNGPFWAKTVNENRLWPTNDGRENGRRSGLKDMSSHLC